MRLVILVFILLGGWFACTTTGSSVLVSEKYDTENNETILALAPYGSIKIPGEWKNYNYNSISRQYFLRDKEATTIAIAKNPKDQYPFYEESQTDIAFATAFYKWEQKHYEKEGFALKEIEAGEDYVVWLVTGEGTNTLFLYGGKGAYAYNFSVFSDNWADETRMAFLKKLFEINS